MAGDRIAGRGAPDGPATLRWRFADGSEEVTEAEVADGLATRPAGTPRRIRSVERV
ncbi:hypothetical protein [Sphingomonas gilva]|uniref:hypothetical protein n=1 Tax=Sphingomonas gilva TaxID=2305907 RepID=UPI0015FDBA26|nr:hypothetical protein [Sphingomonas gilva]